MEEGTWLGAQVTELHIRDWKQVDTGKGRLVIRVPSGNLTCLADTADRIF